MDGNAIKIDNLGLWAAHCPKLPKIFQPLRGFLVQLMAPGPWNEGFGRFRKVSEGSRRAEGVRGAFNQPLLRTLYAFSPLTNPYEGGAPFNQPT